MLRIVSTSKLAFAVIVFICSTQLSFAAENPRVALKTDLGTIVIELYPEKAPLSANNFLTYVDSKFYDGTIFHRVVPGFVVQGGGMTFDFASKPTRDPIKNESNNGLGNNYGTVAMARTQKPDSASSQFYINLKDNNALDGSESKPGYAVFGKVVLGMDVVVKIEKEPRGMHRSFPEAPDYAVRILQAFRVDHAFVPEKMKDAPTPTKIHMKNSNVSDALVKP